MRWNWKVKVKLAVVLGATAALFAAVGYWLIPRDDPVGPFILGNISHQVLTLALLAGMAATCATFGALCLHRDLPHAAWLVIGFGWATLALRSPPIDHLLIFIRSPAQLQGLYLRLLGELLLLSLISATAYAFSRWAGRIVPRRRRSPPGARPADAASDPPGPPPDAAAQARRLAADSRRPASTARRRRLAALPGGDSLPDLAASFFATAVLAVPLYLLLVSRSPLRGQTLAAVAAGFFLAALASHQLFPTRTPWGLVLSVPATAAVCYLLAVFGSGAARAFAYEAPLRLSRPMPIDFLGMALPAVIAAYLVSLHLADVRRDNARQAAAPS